MRVEVAIERGETCLPPIKNQTKCAKMTEENDTTIIKNGINGAVAVARPIGTGSGEDGSVVTTTVTAAVHVSRGNAINLSSGANGGASANNQRKASLGAGYPSSGGELATSNHSSHELSAATQGNSNINSRVESVRVPNTGFGGRLQFFKDGKFILELARSREGERFGWVSVPRKTFWPPSAPSTTTSTYPKNESSTSLSFSDDNSSIQSSPWQRDHCWKQATPRRGLSKEMGLFFKRTKKFTLSHDGYKIAQMKRRRPYDNSMCKLPFTLVNGIIKTEIINPVDIKIEIDEKDSLNVDKNLESIEAVNSTPTIKVEDEVNRKMEGENSRQGKKLKKCTKLDIILEKMIARLPAAPFYIPKVNPSVSSGILNHFPASVRITELHNHQQHVSPRKRILRELEKVSLEDSSTKRSRAKANATPSLAIAGSLSSNSSASQIANSMSQSQRSSVVQNTKGVSSNHVSNGNGNNSTIDTNPNNNSSRLNSSYSIHSLLGNTTIVSKSESDLKDSLESSCLQSMLTNANPSETYYSSRTAYTNSSAKLKSPTYNVASEPHNNRRSSRESPNNYGPNYPSESSLSPDPINRYKAVANSSSGAAGFHPYSSSPKYSSNAASPTMLCDSFKQITGYSSPNHSQMTSKAPTTSRSPVVSTFSQQSLHSSKNSNLNNNRFREQSPGESSSPGSSSADRRDGTPRTVPKKTVAIRQQFSSPTSSPSAVHSSSHDLSNIYKSPSDQKRKATMLDEQRTFSPESNKLYQSSLDQLEQAHRAASLIRAPPALPTSSYCYIYPSHGSSGAAHTSQPSYIPPLYYPLTPYAAAVAALRNPFWMHYQTAGLASRLTFPYNGESSLGSHHSSAPPGLSSMHLPSGPVPPWPSPINLPNSVTDDPVSLVNVKDEHNADVPLNLSKH